MNRIIKFRAWDKDMNEMVFVSGIQFDPHSPYARPNIIDQHNDLRNLDELELMQFTGLKDKNGKEIFDGDIIIGNPQSDVITERKFIIGWMNSCWCLIHTESKEVLCSISAYYIEAVEKWATVISNIYENPELIKQDGQ
jgi:uncharacterized phage protein (TIGR01671 family)